MSWSPEVLWPGCNMASCVHWSLTIYMGRTGHAGMDAGAYPLSMGQALSVAIFPLVAYSILEFGPCTQGWMVERLIHGFPRAFGPCTQGWMLINPVAVRLYEVRSLYAGMDDDRTTSSSPARTFGPCTQGWMRGRDPGTSGTSVRSLYAGMDAL